MMGRLSSQKTILSTLLFCLVLSLTLAVISLYPVATGEQQSRVIIDASFTLHPNETRRQGLGSFHGGENIFLNVHSSDTFVKNFSILTYNGLRYANYTDKDIAFNFTAGADYYESVFFSNATNTGTVHFTVSVEQPEVFLPYSWLNLPAKILFFVSLGAVCIFILKFIFSKQANEPFRLTLPPLGRTGRRRLIALLLLSLVFWVSLLAVNSHPLATFENWYTDHARHAYVSSLFLKDGLNVFSDPLDALASRDQSGFMFVTWPEMPHLYPLGSLVLFLPFGILLQNGFGSVLTYKLMIVVFLVFAHACLFLFLNRYWKKDMHTFLKLLGIYIIYVTLVIYAANGMFDSVAFLFSLLALTAFALESYDSFLLLTAISVFLKYQAGIFLLPLVVVGAIVLFKKQRLGDLVANKSLFLTVVLVVLSGFTAYLSLPYLMNVRPEFIMNGVNAFEPHSQIPWSLQAFSVLLTLAITVVYSLYMLNKNSLLSLSALFLLLPTFVLPYVQNWYLSFVFVYVLIPQRKREVEATMLWLIFMIGVLSFGGVSFNPLRLLDNFRTLLKF
ncbi:MAG: hypothetical protein NWE98_05765 [Candidatus Bathyarchaeota archaeon]|nr:hypothetical protein [Candidatus Bathyarchaeota archaeon]